MDEFKKHMDTLAVIISFIVTITGSMIWINGKFNNLEKEVAIIKTVMIIKNIMPPELASKNIENTP